MRKEGRDRKVNVKEKFGDYLMDVSKYVLTAVMLTALFDDVLTKVWMKYVFGLTFILLVIIMTLFYFYKDK